MGKQSRKYRDCRLLHCSLKFPANNRPILYLFVHLFETKFDNLINYHSFISRAGNNALPISLSRLAVFHPCGKQTCHPFLRLFCNCQESTKRHITFAYSPSANYFTFPVFFFPPIYANAIR